MLHTMKTQYHAVRD